MKFEFKTSRMKKNVRMKKADEQKNIANRIWSDRPEAGAGAEGEATLKPEPRPTENHHHDMMMIFCRARLWRPILTGLFAIVVPTLLGGRSCEWFSTCVI